MGGILKEGKAFSILICADSDWFCGQCRVRIHCFLGDMKCFSHAIPRRTIPTMAIVILDFLSYEWMQSYG